MGNQVSNQKMANQHDGRGIGALGGRLSQGKLTHPPPVVHDLRRCHAGGVEPGPSQAGHPPRQARHAARSDFESA